MKCAGTTLNRNLQHPEGPYPCEKSAKYEHTDADGRSRWYCRDHHPRFVKARAEAGVQTLVNYIVYRLDKLAPKVEKRPFILATEVMSRVLDALEAKGGAEAGAAVPALDATVEKKRESAVKVITRRGS